MSINQRLDLRQTQGLVMTPQLQQAIKLLQMSNLELSVFIEQECEQNPLLERADSDAGDDGPGPREGGADNPGDDSGDGSGGMDANGADSADLIGSDHIAGDAADPLDVETPAWADDVGAGEPEHGSRAFDNAGSRSGGFDIDDPNLEQTLSESVSLRDHLTRQFQIDVADPVDRAIGTQLIDLVDDSGYLTADLGEVAERLGCDITMIQSVLDRLQRLDPPGILARSLGECLALQLRDLNRLDPAMQALLDNLPMLANGDLAGLRRRCGVDGEDLAEMIGEIRALNPKPGAGFDQAVVQSVTPDVLMFADAEGGWRVELNPDTLPRVLLDTQYYQTVSKTARTKEDRDYLTDRYQYASWLVRALHQRATTILKVASEIVRQQDAFFVHGVQHLKPMVLRQIAETISMHESTVSRVTNGKYIATPRGVFELKYFFTTAIGGTEGADAHSAEAVRFRIRALVDTEAPDAVLSDDRIVEILREEGVDIARRTVAKYRESLRIPSSVQRRRSKAAQRAVAEL